MSISKTALALYDRVSGGITALPVPRRFIPRYDKVLDNLQRPDLTEQRERVQFFHKFSGESAPFSVADPDPVIDTTVITPPRRLYALGRPGLYRALTSKPYVDGGPMQVSIVGAIGPRVNGGWLAEEIAEGTYR